MKKSMFLILLLALALASVSAQRIVTVNGTEIELDDLEELEELQNLAPGTKNVKIMINKEAGFMGEDTSGYFGIYVEDLSFPKAQKLSYPNNFGVLITGVVQGSPAWDARLQEEDIIMSMNDKPVYTKEEFDRLRKNMRAGDPINLKLWRSGSEVELEMVLGSRTAPTASGMPEKPMKKKSSVGYGGGAWTPMWLSTDMTDVNDLMTDLGFQAYDENGALTQGFAGKGHIGKGFFLGMQVNSFSDSRKIRDNSDPANPFDLRANYDLSMVGATVDKRFALTRWLITSVGVMLGGADHQIDITRTNEEYHWPTSAGDVAQGNFNGKLRRGYLLVHPRAELMFRLLPWLGLRAEAGYAYTYAPYKGWRVQGDNEEMVEIQNSPDTPLEGITIGIGPWFGF